MCVRVCVCWGSEGGGGGGGGVSVTVCLLNFARLEHRVSSSYAMTQAGCALKAAAMVTDMLAPAPHVTLSIISACFYIMVFD